MIKNTVKIPTRWREVRLGEVVDICTGKKDVNEGSPNGKYPFFSCSQNILSSDEYSFDSEAVLVAGNGDFNVKYYDGKFEAYQRTYVITNKLKNNLRYIFYILLSGINKITENNQGSTIKYIRIGDLQNYKILLPPLATQNKIAEILGSVDEEIDLVNNEIVDGEKLRDGMMIKFFREKLKIKCEKLRDADIEIIDGDRGKNYPKQQEFSGSGYCLFLNTKNIQEDKFNFDDCKFITKEKDELLRKGKLKRMDVVLTTRGTVGNVALYDGNVPYKDVRINSGMLIFRVGIKYDAVFLYKYLSSNIIKNIFKSMSSGSAQPQLPIRSLNLLDIPVFSLDEQKQIAVVLVAVDEKIQIIKNLKNNLIQLKKGLMVDLLNGKEYGI